MPVGPGVIPPVLVLEASRQAGLAIAHSGFDVGLDHEFLLDEATMRWIGDQPRAETNDPVQAILDVSIPHVTRKRESVSALAFHGSWSIEGLAVVSAHARMRCLSPARMRGLRRIRSQLELSSSSAPPPVAESSLRQIHWDATDPMLFDHNTDHLPGMVLADAAIAAAGEFRAFSMRFLEFAELNRPLYIRSFQSPGAVVAVEFLQCERIVARGMWRGHDELAEQ